MVYFQRPRSLTYAITIVMRSSDKGRARATEASRYLYEVGCGVKSKARTAHLGCKPKTKQLLRVSGVEADPVIHDCNFKPIISFPLHTRAVSRQLLPLRCGGGQEGARCRIFI